MPDAGVRYRGLDETIRAFGVLPRQVGAEVADALRPVIHDMRGQLAIYPAERPGQKYVRTGDLGRGWLQAQERYIVTADGGVDVAFENRVEYVDAVQGDDQETIFRGRWTMVSTVMTEFEGDITLAVEQGVIRALEKLDQAGA